MLISMICEDDELRMKEMLSARNKRGLGKKDTVLRFHASLTSFPSGVLLQSGNDYVEERSCFPKCPKEGPSNAKVTAVKHQF